MSPFYRGRRAHHRDTTLTGPTHPSACRNTSMSTHASQPPTPSYTPSHFLPIQSPLDIIASRLSYEPHPYPYQYGLYQHSNTSASSTSSLESGGPSTPDSSQFNFENFESGNVDTEAGALGAYYASLRSLDFGEEEIQEEVCWCAEFQGEFDVDDWMEIDG